MKLSPSAQRVQDALQERGFAHLRVQELAASTRTAQEAADAVGCTVGQIVKSLIFRGASSGRPYLLLVSGAHRVNLHGLEAELGEKLEKPNAEYVRQVTGFAIGGVPPVGHVQPLEALIDPDLLQYERIYAAAGTPFALFGLSPDELIGLTGGRILQPGLAE
ncbi:YbaK/EbsC family protein [Meiothermus sp.]|jgi:prolyl-tRNA editing enzyme YbaK/EbsC (Cys-tRNA(Pro) deacylase)|uniref:YbaK/EbsC family protein n=1 Tax=Meiothermus sp. TaxID=1955249 RepID=UPI0021DDCC8F|nr:YbaK/EbsC family protein [Meiothermus sp.]GIW26379.1 MAG: prolyl-tRNA editing protein [Meiothermus sp.]